MSPTTAAPSRRLTPSVYVAAATVGVALLLGAAALTSPLLTACVVGLCGMVLAWGWAGTLGLPTPRGTVGVVVVGSLALCLAVTLPTGPPWLGWLPAGLCLAMIAAFAHQLLRTDGRPRVVESVSSVVLALALVGCGALFVASARSADGVALALAALAAAAASAVTDLCGRWDRLRAWLLPLALAAGGLAAVLTAVLLDAPASIWLLAGVASGALSHALRAVLGPLPTLAHARPRLVAGVASVLVVGMVPYLVALGFLDAGLPR